MRLRDCAAMNTHSSHRPVRALVFVLLATLWLTAVRAETISPVDTIQSFFSWALVRHASTLPSPKETGKLAKWITPELVSLLDKARVTQDRCIRTTPQGDKPDLLEGDIFVGNEEGATEAAYQAPKQMGGKTAVAVDLLSVDKRWPQGDRRRAVAWKADVTLVQISGRWYVEDIRFASDRSLRATLQGYNDEGARECIAR